MSGDTKPTTTSAILPPPPSLLASSSRASPFAPTLSNAMAPSAFMASSQSAFRPSLSAHSGVFTSPITSPFDRDPSKAVGAPLTTTSPPGLSSIRIYGLPPSTSEDALRLMTVFSKEVIDVCLLPPHSPEAPFRSAVVGFATPAGAVEAKNILDGKPNVNNEGQMRVEIIGGSPILARKSPGEDALSTGALNTPSAGSSVNPSRQPSRFANNTFQSALDPIPATAQSLYGSDQDLIKEATSAHLYRDQSPIGNYMSDRSLASGKMLINRDTTDDDDTGAIMMNPIEFVENGSIAAQRRATAPQVPIERMQGLSLNTTTDITGSVPNLPTPYSHQGSGSLSAHPNAMSPTAMTSPHPYQNPAYPFSYGRGANHMPPANPADMNPPCNTLYVGNLPIDTSEEELKTIFIRQRGYKRLCFRTKQNGPMCFVEFEDTHYAVQALKELYGIPLSNSVKGGIRLSFSKNPLGVRSGQNPNQQNGGMMNGMNGHMQGGSAFTTASGPPPGLAAPPGLGGRMSYNNGTGGGHPYGPASYASGPNGSTNGGNPWGDGPMYNGAMAAAGGSNSMFNGAGSGYPAFMMGR